MKTGERPGEKVLEERATILPLFGAMLKNGFGPIFEQQILPAIPAFAEVEARQPEDVASSIDLQLTIQQHNVPP